MHSEYQIHFSRCPFSYSTSLHRESRLFKPNFKRLRTHLVISKINLIVALGYVAQHTTAHTASVYVSASKFRNNAAGKFIVIDPKKNGKLKTPGGLVSTFTVSKYSNNVRARARVTFEFGRKGVTSRILAVRSHQMEPKHKQSGVRHIDMAGGNARTHNYIAWRSGAKKCFSVA